MYIQHTQFCTFNVHNYQKMYIILYIQCIHFLRNAQNSIPSSYTFFKESTQLFILNVYNFSKNLHNFVHLIYTIFKEYTQFCTFNIHNFQRTYIIMYNKRTNFLNECLQWCTFNLHIFFLSTKKKKKTYTFSYYKKYK